jgi:hypothetical protein
MNSQIKNQCQQDGPNWRGFAEILAIGYLRTIGLKPIPQEVIDRLIKEGKIHLLPSQYKKEVK